MKEKTLSFLKTYGIYLIIGVVVLAVGLSVMLIGLNNDNIAEPIIDTSGDIEDESPSTKVPAQVEPLSFSLPTLDAKVIEDYNSSALVKSQTLNHWASHKYMEIVSNTGSKDVLAVLDGVVSKCYYDYGLGYVIVIDHANNTQSLYASLADNSSFAVGSEVKKGDKIGEMSTSASNEIANGEHLHFELYENGQRIDPNVYLDLSVK